MQFPDIYIYNGLILFLNSIIHLVKYKNKIRFFFGLWILGAAWYMIHSGLYYLGIIKTYPWLYGTIILGKYINIPSIFFTFYFLLNPYAKWRRSFYLWYTPFFLYFIYLIYFQYVKQDSLHIIIENYLNQGVAENLLTDPLWLGTIYVYFVMFATIRHVFIKINWKTLIYDFRNKNQFKIATSVILFLTIFQVLIYNIYTNIVSYIDKSWHGLIITFLIFSATLVLLVIQLYIFSLRIFYHNKRNNEYISHRYIKSYLNKTDIEKIKISLDKLLFQKFYTDPDLTAEIMANKLNINLHQLSEYFNQKLKCNFRNYINTKRLDNTINELLHQPEKSITQIWLDSGFNSSSSFYRIFKEKTGMSPEEYRAFHKTAF